MSYVLWNNGRESRSGLRSSTPPTRFARGGQLSQLPQISTKQNISVCIQCCERETEGQYLKIGGNKKWKFSFFHQRHALWTSFLTFFVVAHTVTNFLTKLEDMLLIFCGKIWISFFFPNSLFFGVAGARCKAGNANVHFKPYRRCNGLIEECTVLAGALMTPQDRPFQLRGLNQSTVSVILSSQNRGRFPSDSKDTLRETPQGARKWRTRFSLQDWNSTLQANSPQLEMTQNPREAHIKLSIQQSPKAFCCVLKRLLNAVSKLLYHTGNGRMASPHVHKIRGIYFLGR